MSDAITDIVSETGMSIIRGDVLYRIYVGERTDDEGYTEDCYVLAQYDRASGETAYIEHGIESEPRELMDAIFPADEWRQFFIPWRSWFASYIG